MLEGLNNLNELHLNYLNIQVFVLGASNTNIYKSLKILDLAYNRLTAVNGICNMSSLEKIDLSYNKMRSFHVRTPCDLANLKAIQLESQIVENPGIFGLSLNSLVLIFLISQQWMPMTMLLTHIMQKQFCAQMLLFFIYLEAILELNLNLYMPRLKGLYLSRLRSLRPIDTLELFKSSQLRTVDLSSNQISVIYKENAMDE